VLKHVVIYYKPHKYDTILG